MQIFGYSAAFARKGRNYATSFPRNKGHNYAFLGFLFLQADGRLNGGTSGATGQEYANTSHHTILSIKEVFYILNLFNNFLKKIIFKIAQNIVKKTQENGLIFEINLIITSELSERCFFECIL